MLCLVVLDLPSLLPAMSRLSVITVRLSAPELCRSGMQRILLFCVLANFSPIRLILAFLFMTFLVLLFVEVILLVRNLIDSLVMHLLKWCFNWLYSQYDVFFDGVELWIQDKLPDMPELEDFEKE